MKNRHKAIRSDAASGSLGRNKKSTFSAELIAGGILLSASIGADAAIQYTAGNVTLNPGDKFNVDIDGGGYDLYFSFRNGVLRSFQMKMYGASGAYFFQVDATHGYAKNFSAGQTISAPVIGPQEVVAVYDTISSVWMGKGTVAGYEDFYDTKTGYVGFRLNNGTGNYGWIHVDSIASDSMHISGWAYEDSGATITAGAGEGGGGGGAVPEPSGLALLACGAAGICALRKKRKSNEA